jgi:hypothetical protein
VVDIEVAAESRRSELVEGGFLDLPDALGAHAEDAGELAERLYGPLEAEALVHDPALARIQLVEK